MHVSFGEKCRASVPVVMPFSTAQRTASKYHAPAGTSSKGVRSTVPGSSLSEDDEPPLSSVQSAVNVTSPSGMRNVVSAALASLSVTPSAVQPVKRYPAREPARTVTVSPAAYSPAPEGVA